MLNTPKSRSYADARRFDRLLYDSDDQDSMASEYGSAQDVAMSSDDEMMQTDDATTPIVPCYDARAWQSIPARIQQTHRVPTPILPPLSSPSSRPGYRAMQVRTNMKHHVRHRHPQEIFSNSSDLLEVPSPVDEDEVPTPPSAAEAAGSQLSMLTVNDMDIEASHAALPTIAVDPSQALPFAAHVPRSFEADSAIADGFEPMEGSDSLGAGLVVRKQRARSGALSSGHGSSSPSRADAGRPDLYCNGAARRGFSLGFRADCEKCQMRVPGHMNHFV